MIEFKKVTVQFTREDKIGDADKILDTFANTNQI